MAIVDVYDINKKIVGKLELSDAVFDVDVKEYLIHEAVKVQLANRRAGTVAVKNRSAVSGSGKKPFKQKGTGGARQGCKRAPQYPGGGVAFGPQPKTYNLRMNKKARRAAICSALTLLFRENKLTVLNNLDLDAISTKGFVNVLDTFDLSKALIIADAGRNLELSARNVRDIKLSKPEALTIFDLMKFQNLMVTKDAVFKMEGALQS